MRNAIRCFIACIFPCGAFDVIRIIHSNGKVEEISDSHIKASQIMKLYPKHILKKPKSSYHDHDHQEISSPKIVVVPPDAELQRGKIYFLMPMPSLSMCSSSTSSSSSLFGPPREKLTTRRNKKKTRRQVLTSEGWKNGDNANVLMSSNDQYLSEILSEKVPTTKRDKRRGRVGVWRPHLESISETLSESS